MPDDDKCELCGGRGWVVVGPHIPALGLYVHGECPLCGAGDPALIERADCSPPANDATTESKGD